MTYSAFEVVVVPFPFTDRPVQKRRPALVLSSADFNSRHGHAILSMITTARQSDWPTDVPLTDWKEAGLKLPCRVRLKLFTLDTALIDGSVGRLSTRDVDAVKAVLAQCFGLTVGFTYDPP
ncbi:MAG: type II toxin-antitoxin system PemK/MazF family toxin [Alphaproteobacteria bacterium]|nr:type II toxin-antitoxin system PemK/MazF family toxin [Alphaproteobacteria bacterium]